MEHITQVMPAAPWVAVYARTNPDGTDRREEVPLVGWALVCPPSPSLPPAAARVQQQHLVGMVAGRRSVELVDQEDEAFRGYELPHGMSIRADLDKDDAQREWDERFLITDDDSDDPPQVAFGR